jgi:hypothetical protein
MLHVENRNPELQQYPTSDVKAIAFDLIRFLPANRNQRYRTPNISNTEAAKNPKPKTRIYHLYGQNNVYKFI